MWAGTWTRPSRLLPRRYLNPPRPCGRGLSVFFAAGPKLTLKSAPPVWAGTLCNRWQGLNHQLKSAPPVWAGTWTRPSRLLPRRYLNPPRPCGRGPDRRGVRHYHQHLNPPRPCGRGPTLLTWRQFRQDLNPPRPCGRGPPCSRHIPCRIPLKSAPPVWAGTTVNP